MHRPRLQHAAVGLSGALLAASLALPAPLPAQQPVDTVLSLTIDDHRPLAALADALEKRFQIVITYEEGAWVASSDLQDVTAAIVQANGPGRAAPAAPVIVPRKAAVSFDYPLDPARGLPSDDTALLSALLIAYDAAGGPGKFRFEGGNGLYHLIPSKLQSGTNRAWHDVAPVLSIPVQLADDERTVDATLEAIVAQVNLTSPVKIGWGLVPINLFRQTKVRLAANGVPAREALRQVLQKLPRRVTWRLNYDPTDQRYYLSFLPR